MKIWVYCLLTRERTGSSSAFDNDEQPIGDAFKVIFEHFNPLVLLCRIWFLI